MLPDRVSNLEPLALESNALLTALRGPVQALRLEVIVCPGTSRNKALI